MRPHPYREMEPPAIEVEPLRLHDVFAVDYSTFWCRTCAGVATQECIDLSTPSALLG